MADTTKISWTDSTFSPWWGCTKVSPACYRCYAEELSDHRFKRRDAAGRPLWDPHADRLRTAVSTWRNPLTWQRTAEAFARLHGRRRRVFCASMSDVFDNQAPKEWREELWALIRQCADLDWLVLSKRPLNIKKMLPPDWGDGYPNVWLGITAESQDYFNQRWPILAATPAIIRFVSAEPLLGKIDIGDARPDWLICGGESGSGARMMPPQWARDIRDQCALAGVPFFMKQMTKNPADPRRSFRETVS